MISLRQILLPWSFKKSVWLAGFGCCVLLVLTFTHRRGNGARGVTVTVLGHPQLTNAGVICTVVLSNETARSYNIVNDTDGKPLFILDHGGKYPEDSYGKWLGRVRNDLKLNLAAGASMTNNVLIRNPPPRFRLHVIVRDLSAESRDGLLSIVLPKKLVRSRREPPASDWIEIKTGE